MIGCEEPLFCWIQVNWFRLLYVRFSDAPGKPPVRIWLAAL
jgi:hypothetical protein